MTGGSETSPVESGMIRRGQTRNDMTATERLLWVPTIAIALAIGFGMLATGHGRPAPPHRPYSHPVPLEVP
jgi:hypothetical protein